MMTKNQKEENMRGYDGETRKMWKEALAELKKIHDPETIQKREEVKKLMDAYFAKF